MTRRPSALGERVRSCPTRWGYTLRVWRAGRTLQTPRWATCAAWPVPAETASTSLAREAAGHRGRSFTGACTAASWRFPLGRAGGPRGARGSCSRRRALAACGRPPRTPRRFAARRQRPPRLSMSPPPHDGARWPDPKTRRGLRRRFACAPRRGGRTARAFLNLNLGNLRKRPRGVVQPSARPASCGAPGGGAKRSDSGRTTSAVRSPLYHVNAQTTILAARTIPQPAAAGGAAAFRRARSGTGGPGTTAAGFRWSPYASSSRRPAATRREFGRANSVTPRSSSAPPRPAQHRRSSALRDFPTPRNDGSHSEAGALLISRLRRPIDGQARRAQDRQRRHPLARGRERLSSRRGERCRRPRTTGEFAIPRPASASRSTRGERGPANRARPDGFPHRRAATVRTASSRHRTLEGDHQGRPPRSRRARSTTCSPASRRPRGGRGGRAGPVVRRDDRRLVVAEPGALRRGGPARPLRAESGAAPPDRVGIAEELPRGPSGSSSACACARPAQRLCLPLPVDALGGVTRSSSSATSLVWAEALGLRRWIATRILALGGIRCSR